MLDSLEVIKDLRTKFPDFVVNLLAGFAELLIVALVVFARERIVMLWFIAWRATVRICSRKPFILIWNDHDRAVGIRLATALRRHLTGARIEAIESPHQVRYYPLHPWFVRAVILIDTDVTKFSERERTREQVEQSLMSFLERGGGLVGTHDVNYRRVRNTKLQKAFGCEVVDFVRSNGPIEYVVDGRHSGHPLRQGLKDQFSLDDGEVIFGPWHDQAQVVYATTEGKPLVIANHFGGGRLVWLNSGDKKQDSLCPSLNGPQSELVQLLANAVGWVSANDRGTTHVQPRAEDHGDKSQPAHEPDKPKPAAVARPT